MGHDIPFWCAESVDELSALLIMIRMKIQDVKLLFGERVRELRKDAGMTQEELADYAELDRSYVGSVERGERNLSIENVCRLANAINISPAEFFSWWQTK